MTERRILVVDDHPVVESTEYAIARRAPGPAGGGAGRRAGQAVRLTTELQPDAVILDLRMAAGSPGASASVKAAAPGTKVLIHTRVGASPSGAACTGGPADARCG